MSLIEIEFLKSAFESSVGLIARTGRAVPFPTLTPLGDERLILTFLWQGEPSIEAGFPGFTPPPGTLLLRSSVVLTHASLDEIRLQPDTPGVSTTGTAWLLVRATTDQAVLHLVGFGVGKERPVALASPQPLATLPLPVPKKAIIVAAALVAADSIVVLRLATSALDNPLQPVANRLLVTQVELGVGQANWLMYIPADFFVAMFLNPLVAFLSPPPDGVTIEDAPAASWIQHGSGAWGVSARAGVEKIDACPGLFDDVDISADISVSAEFVANLGNNQLDINLTIETDASDWDAFRCWLGNLGIVSFALGLINPYLGAAAAIASLITVGEVVRKQVGEELDSVSIDDFKEVSRTSSSVSYSGSFPVNPIPASVNVAFALGPTGLNVWGTTFPIAPPHVTSFNPNRGPLTGAWTSKVNCSHRTLDHAFTFQDVLVSDEVGGTAVPVVVYLTSIAEPVGKCWIDAWDAQPKLPVHIRASGMRPGEAGFVVLHTSAGLRAYALAPLPAVTSLLPGMQSLIDAFCDSLSVPSREINIYDLRWVEPPPDYNWGFDPIRQWQVVVQGLPEDIALEVRAISDDGPLLATRDDFSLSEGSAAIELVTDAETDLVLHMPDAGAEANVSLTTRWLLPQHREAFDAPLRAFSRAGSMLMLHTDAGERIFDLDLWTSSTAPYSSIGQTRVVDRPGQSLSLKSNRVAIIHEGELVIAAPLNTLVRETSDGGSEKPTAQPKAYRQNETGEDY
ncbi:MAG TPA: hypothetical protein VJT09_01970 [Pyrinomonadaceae bacterium]|nr:hypothetical protein [Pyrinomonadaceae bacterium]